MKGAPQYLVIGNVTQDLLADGSYRLGGTATYSALTATRLGLRTAVLTSYQAELTLFADEPGIQVVRVPSPTTTMFENIYAGWARRQFIRAEAAVLRPEHVPVDWRETPIVHLGPIAHECDPSLVQVLRPQLLGITPQGWLRSWDGDGHVHPQPYACAPELVRAADVVVLSMEDLGDDREALAHYVRLARLLVLTLGPDGALLIEKGRQTHAPAFDVVEADPTGAGDVFATAFMIRYYETGDPLVAAQFANCVASFIIESVGTANVPTRESVQKRLVHGKLRVRT